MDKRFYLVAMLVGIVAPWYFFLQFFAAEGGGFALFVESLFVNGAAAGIVADVSVAAIVFMVWAAADARRLGVRRWWLIFPAAALVGLSLAMPLYLYMRHDYAVTGA